MAIPCNRPYSRNPLDGKYMAGQLGLSEYDVRERLHTIKRFSGLRGDHSVVICLDNGLVYDRETEELLGSLNSG